MNDVKRAAAFYRLIRLSYGSGCTSYGCQPFDIRKIFHLLWQGSRRLKDTVIENKDFEELIKQYDRENAFIYCDPPYYQTEGHYAVEFKKDDHYRLRDTNGCEYAEVLISNYDTGERLRDMPTQLGLFNLADFHGMEGVRKAMNRKEKKAAKRKQYTRQLINTQDVTGHKALTPNF